MSAAVTSAELDKSKFDTTLPLVALKIPAKMCTQYMTTLRDHLFQRPRMKRILDATGPDGSADPLHRLVLLSEAFGSDLSLSSLGPQLQQFIRENGPGVPEPYSLKLGYEHLSVEEVLRKVLPSGSEIPSSFEQAGHIAHLNLREEVLPFKRVIGQVILDKNPSLRTVVNKMGNIENEFRTFPMEVLAGDDDFNVTVRESGAKFTFNFRSVYWNSRLQTEHARLIQLLVNSAARGGVGGAVAAATEKKQTLVVADMMAGVGPFAVPLAMTSDAHIAVYANDLNPESHASLTSNARANHCASSRLVASNKDARRFVLDLVSQGVRFHEAIMNLPANATDFLDVFVGLETRYEQAAAESGSAAEAAAVATPRTTAQPRIHVYGFSSAGDVVADMVERVAGVLRCPVESLGYSGAGTAGGNVDVLACWGHVVRDVSPKKMMVCVSFRLPLEVARAQPLATLGGGGRPEREKPRGAS